MRAIPWKALVPALGVMLLVQVLFVFCYLAATASPKPEAIPFGVVGGTDTALVQEVQKAAGTVLTVRAYPSAVEAHTAIDEQEIFGALAVSTPGQATLYIATAAGPSVAKVLTTATPTAAARFGTTVTVSDLRPLPATDANGLGVFYVTLACVVYGYAGVLVALGILGAFSLGQRLLVILGFSLVGALLTALVAGPIGGLPISYLPFAGLSALIMLVSGLATALAVEVGGQKAVPVVLIVLLVLGSPSSGGAVAPELLPPFFRVIGQWLPPGAGVTALRNNVYFADHQHWMPILVLLAWAALCLLGWVLTVRRSAQRVGANGSSSAGMRPVTT